MVIIIKIDETSNIIHNNNNITIIMSRYNWSLHQIMITVVIIDLCIKNMWNILELWNI